MFATWDYLCEHDFSGEIWHTWPCSVGGMYWWHTMFPQTCNDGVTAYYSLNQVDTSRCTHVIIDTQYMYTHYIKAKVRDYVTSFAVCSIWHVIQYMVTFHVPIGSLPMPLWYYVNSLSQFTYTSTDGSHVSDVAVCWFIWNCIYFMLTIYYMLKCSPT